MNANAANYSASNEASQVVHDANESLIKSAELAAAWRKLGLTDDEGMALVARQQKLNPAETKDSVVRSVIAAAQDLENQGLGLVTQDQYQDPSSVIEYGSDQADLQTVVAADRDSEGNVKDYGTKERKTATEAVRAAALDRDIRTTKPKGYFSPSLGRIVYDDGSIQGQVPQRVLERRVEPSERINIAPRQARNPRAQLSSAQLAMKDVLDRMEAAFATGQLELSPENLSLFDRLEAKIYDDRAIQQEANLAKELDAAVETRVNEEVRARNAAKSLTVQEAALLERVNRGLGRIGEVQIAPQGQKDYIREVPRSTLSPGNMPMAESTGNVYIDSAGNPLAIQGPELGEVVASNPTERLLLEELYDYRTTDHTLPQTEIRAPLNLLESRLSGFSKWGTLQNAPTTIRGITDLDQALNSVIALGKSQGKAFYSMPGVDGASERVAEPGPREALKALGYNMPETTQLMNALGQAQMYKNNQPGNSQIRDALVRRMYSSTQPNLYFDSPEQMGDFQSDFTVGKVENPAVRKAFRSLTGENIQGEDRAIVLNMAQQPFSGEVSGRAARTPIDAKGQQRNAQPAIEGRQGNPNIRYDKLGISNLADLQYAREQADLRRNARVKIEYGTDSTGREVVPKVRRQVGQQTDAQKRNTTSALLAQARAQRDAQKSLPPAQPRAPLSRNEIFDRPVDPWTQPPATGRGVTSGPVNFGSPQRALPYGIDTSGPNQGPQRAAQQGPTQRTQPYDRTFEEKLSFLKNKLSSYATSPRYTAGRRVGIAGSAASALAVGLDALISNEQEKREKQELYR